MTESILTTEWKEKLLEGAIDKEDEYFIRLRFMPVAGQKKRVVRVRIELVAYPKGIVAAYCDSDPLDVTTDTLSLSNLRRTFEIKIA